MTLSRIQAAFLKDMSRWYLMYSVCSHDAFIMGACLPQAHWYSGNTLPSYYLNTVLSRKNRAPAMLLSHEGPCVPKPWVGGKGMYVLKQKGPPNNTPLFGFSLRRTGCCSWSGRSLGDFAASNFPPCILFTFFPQMIFCFFVVGLEKTGRVRDPCLYWERKIQLSSLRNCIASRDSNTPQHAEYFGREGKHIVALHSAHVEWEQAKTIRNKYKKNGHGCCRVGNLLEWANST